MNYEETLKLIDAGFTADEIREMAKAGETPEPVSESSGEQSKENQVHESALTEEVGGVIESLTGEVSKLAESVKAIQEQNIKNASTGSAKKTDPVKEQIDAFIKEL